MAESINFMLNYLTYLTSLVEIKLWHLVAGVLTTMLLSSTATAIYFNTTRPICLVPPVKADPVLQAPTPKPVLTPPIYKPTRKWQMVPENDGRKY